MLLGTKRVKYMYVRMFIVLVIGGLVMEALAATIIRIFLVLTYSFQWLTLYLLLHGLLRI